MGNQVGDVTVMQMFPWFGSLDAAKNEVNYMAQMKFSSFIEAKINLYHEVRTTWYQLYQNDKEAELTEKELAILQTLERLALAKYKAAPAGGTAASAGSAGGAKAAGSGSTSTSGGSSGGGMAGMAGMGGSTGSSTAGSQPGGSSGMSGGGMAAMGSSGGSSMVDVLLIRLQVKELENRLQLLREARKPLVTTFNNLLHREPQLPVTSADTLQPVGMPASVSLIQDSIRLNHPMLKMYEWDAKARESQLRMAQLMGRPMIGLGLNYMVFKPRVDEASHMNMGGENMIMPMVTVSLPIYRKKYNAAKKEADYAQQAAGYQREATERQLFTELENLLYEYQSAESRLKLLQEQVALTEQALRLLTTNYSVTGSGMEEILRQRQAVLSYRQQQLQAITGQHTTVSAINRLMRGDN